jgi:hypothetical protein
MKHNTLRNILAIAALGTALTTSYATMYAQQTAAPAARAERAAPAPPKARPTLVWREDWKEPPPPPDPDAVATQQSVTNPNLELKTYGPGATTSEKGSHLVITGAPNNPQNPTHVWTGLCTANCALTLRDKNNFVDLTGQAKVRWVTKVSGFQRVHPIVKLADGSMYAGDWADGTTNDWRETEFYFSEIHWIKMDPARVVTVGAPVEKVDLSKVDEFGWSDFMNASGHGQGGWADVGKIELYGKAVPR